MQHFTGNWGKIAVMGTKTSVYLSDEITKRWKESGRSLADLVRDGLDRDVLQEKMIRRVIKKIVRQEMKPLLEKIPDKNNYSQD